MCAVCQAGLSPQACALCPVRGGAMKRTTQDAWAHLSCALWVPKVRFQTEATRDGIDVSHVPRVEQTCYMCSDASGSCIRCDHSKCKKTFHVSCGLQSPLCKMYFTFEASGVVRHSFCSVHSSK